MSELQAQPQAHQGAFDISNGLHGLGVGVTRTHNLARNVGRGRAGNINCLPHLHGARITHLRFPGCP